MALKSTIFKANLSVADMDRGYYGDHTLTIARHPSETDERMMVRLLAFALHAHDSLEFGRGISVDTEPDLWRKDLTGAIEQWIDVGLPDEKLLRKACGLARQVFVYSYGGRSAEVWWKQNCSRLENLANLTVFLFPDATTRALAALTQRSMALQCTIQEGELWLSCGEDTVSCRLNALKQPASA